VLPFPAYLVVVDQRGQRGVVVPRTCRRVGEVAGDDRVGLAIREDRPAVDDEMIEPAARDHCRRARIGSM
jgi:hypothetical protein